MHDAAQSATKHMLLPFDSSLYLARHARNPHVSSSSTLFFSFALMQRSESAQDVRGLVRYAAKDGGARGGYDHVTVLILLPVSEESVQLNGSVALTRNEFIDHC